MHRFLILPLITLLAASPALAEDADDEPKESEAPPQSEPTPEAMPEPMPEAMPEPMPEAMPEPMPEAMPEAMPEPTLEPTPEPPVAPPGRTSATASAARIYTTGRVGAGLFLADDLVVTLYELVRVGGRVVVTDKAGATADGDIVAFDSATGLALLHLDVPLPASAVPRMRPPMRAAILDESVTWIGHGGTPALGTYDDRLRALANFSSVGARVIAVSPPDLEPDALDDLLIDRLPGDGDRGAPVLGADGAVVGILDKPLKDGGDRARVISARRVAELLDGPRLEKTYLKRSHLQFWSGAGVAAHNRPSHLAGTASVGFRIALLEHLRIEPWFEALVGFRAASATEDADGNTIDTRPPELWWSIETGISFGYRVPIANQTSRDYIVPNAGLRVGWNHFQHREETLVSDCSGAACQYVIDRSRDQVKEFRPGIDLGFDVRHGRVRVGYRFFLAPTAVQAHSMHRVFVTFDGFPLPISAGDSN